MSGTQIYLAGSVEPHGAHMCMREMHGDSGAEHVQDGAPDVCSAMGVGVELSRLEPNSFSAWMNSGSARFINKARGRLGSATSDEATGSNFVFYFCFN